MCRFGSKATGGMVKKFQPHVEALEAREVPAMIAGLQGVHPNGPQYGATLVLNEVFASADRIEIRDTGSAGPGNISWREGGGPWNQRTDAYINNIVVNAGELNDRVDYWFTGNLVPGQFRQVTVNLGKGNDVFWGSLRDRQFTDPGTRSTGVTMVVDGGPDSDWLIGEASGGLGAGTRLNFIFNGGTEKDFLWLNPPTRDGYYQGKPAHGNRLDIPALHMVADSHLFAYLNGGGGDDDLRLFYHGLLGGQLTGYLVGDADHDDMLADITLYDYSPGGIETRFFGGDGDDYMACLVRFLTSEGRPSQNLNTTVETHIDGGSWDDRVWRTPTVTSLPLNVAVDISNYGVLTLPPFDVRYG
jgi:hypothetical protein